MDIKLLEEEVRVLNIGCIGVPWVTLIEKHLFCASQDCQFIDHFNHCIADQIDREKNPEEVENTGEQPIQVDKEHIGGGRDAHVVRETEKNILYLALHAAAASEEEYASKAFCVLFQKLEVLDINARDKQGRTALFWAARNGHAANVRALLQRGANVNIASNTGFTAVMAAVASGNTEVTQMLVDNGAPINLLLQSGSALYLAVGTAQSGSNQAMVRTLLSSGADPNISQGKRGWTPLHLAASRGDVDTVRSLLRNGVIHADPRITDAEGSTALHIAVSTGYIQTVNVLLTESCMPLTTWDHCMIPDAQGFTAMQLAIGNNDVQMVSILGKVGATDLWPSRSSAPLHYASICESPHAIIELLRCGANPKAMDWPGGVNALHSAAANGRLRSIEILLTAGVGVDSLDEEKRWTPLHYAASSGKLYAVKSLLQAGAESNSWVLQHSGYSPLHLAAKMGHADVVRELLNAGARIEHLNNVGRSALELAVRSNELEATQACLSIDVPVWILGRALHQAVSVRGDNHALVRALLCAGANVNNAYYRQSMTPLHVACGKVHLECVKELLVWGADECAGKPNHRPENVIGRNVWKVPTGPDDLEKVSGLVEFGPGSSLAMRRFVQRTRLIKQELRRAPANRAWRRRGWFLMLSLRGDDDVTRKSKKRKMSMGCSTSNEGAAGRHPLKRALRCTFCSESDRYDDVWDGGDRGGCLSSGSRRSICDSSTGNKTESIVEGGGLLHDVVVGAIVLAKTHPGVFRNILSYI